MTGPARIQLWSLFCVLFLLGSGCSSEPPEGGEDTGQDDDDTGQDDDDASDDDDDSLELPTKVEVRVVSGGEPVEGALVLQGGTSPSVLSDSEGRASLELVEIPGDEIWAIAALEGHRSVGERIFSQPAGEITLELTPIQVDNPDFDYRPSGTDTRVSTKYCSHCHISLTEQFAGSAHSIAARDPQVHDLFAGTAAAFDSADACSDAGGRWLAGTLPGGAGPGDRCYIGLGLLPDAGENCGSEGLPACDDPGLPPEDAPQVTGSCADCHAPATSGPLGGGQSLLAVEEFPYEEGVTCDFCHKVASIDPTQPPGLGGRMVLGRPLEEGSLGMGEFKPVMYGPYADVLNPFMGGAISPIFASGELCSGCHEYEQSPLWEHGDTALDPARWPGERLPIHSTWNEWSGSLYAPSSPCQSCHMPPTGHLNSADIELLELTPGSTAGFHRGDQDVRDHGFLGPLDERPDLPRLLDTAAVLSGSASIEGSELLLEASVTNFQTGHGLPTGEPLRSMLLVVDARCGDLALAQTAGPALSQVAGALAVGTVGQEVVVGNASLFWQGLEGVPMDLPVRVTAFRPTGVYLDYEGVAPFASGEDGFPASGKGLPELTPLGSQEVTQSSPETLTPGALLPLEEGDLVIVSELFEEPTEGGAARLLAGQPGIDFARVLADREGRWPVPHYRAVDILRDNRLLPYASDTRSYRFTLPDGCAKPSAQLFLVYRAYPPGLARARGWDSTDHLMATAALSVE